MHQAEVSPEMCDIPRLLSQGTWHGERAWSQQRSHGRRVLTFSASSKLEALALRQSGGPGQAGRRNYEQAAAY